jgi:hypothetical protein
MSDIINVTVKPQNVAAKRLEIAARAIMLAYTCFMAWNVAKAVCPGLIVQEKLLLTRIEHMRHKAQKVTSRQANDFVAAVTSYARSVE